MAKKWLWKNFKWREFSERKLTFGSLFWSFSFGHSRSVYFSTVDFGHVLGNELC